MGVRIRKLTDEHILFLLKTMATGKTAAYAVEKLKEYHGISYSVFCAESQKNKIKWEGVYERLRIEYINDLIASHKLQGPKNSRLDVAIELLETCKTETPNSDERTKFDDVLRTLKTIGGTGGVKGNTITIVNQGAN